LQHSLLCWWTEGKRVSRHPPQLQTTWVTLWKGYLGSEKCLRPYTEHTNSKHAANKLQNIQVCWHRHGSFTGCALSSGVS
jgi:hypothetical protein